MNYDVEINALKRKLDRVFKMLINKRVTDPKMTDSTGKEYYNEFGDSTINVHSSEIWSDIIDSVPTTAITDGVIEKKELFTLTEDLSVSGHAAWYASIIVDSNEVRLKDWVSDKYGSLYNIELFTSAGQQIFPTDTQYGWFWDYQTGILTFSGTLGSYPGPFKVTGYRYIGKKGVSGGGGGVDGVIEINLFPQCTTPYNKTIQYSIPAGVSTHTINFDLGTMLVANKQVEFASYSFACSGYSDGDFLNVYINDIILEDTWYTREVPEESSIGNGVAVYSIPNNSVIKVEFHNTSGTSKILWFKIKLLYNP